MSGCTPSQATCAACEFPYREVVDELAIDEAVDSMVDDLAAFGAHLILFCLFDVCNLLYQKSKGGAGGGGGFRSIPTNHTHVRTYEYGVLLAGVLATYIWGFFSSVSMTMATTKSGPRPFPCYTRLRIPCSYHPRGFVRHKS